MSEEMTPLTPEKAAHEFLDSAQPFLAEVMGGKFDLASFAQFSQVVAGGLLGSLYAILRKESGKAASEAWLTSALGLCSNWVRLHGADAMVNFKIDIVDAPSLLPSQGSPEKQELFAKGPQKPKCGCTLSPKGRCEPCILKIKRMVQQNLEVFQDSYREEKSICHACKVTQTDEALSRVVPLIADAVAEADPKERAMVAQKYIQLTEHVAAGYGLEEAPLTQEAIRKAFPQGIS